MHDPKWQVRVYQIKSLIACVITNVLHIRLSKNLPKLDTATISAVLYSGTCVIYTTGALSVTDDDYCVSYAVTMVDVRSCTRPPRLFSPSSTYIGNFICVVTLYCMQQYSTYV